MSSRTEAAVVRGAARGRLPLRPMLDDLDRAVVVAVVAVVVVQPALVQVVYMVAVGDRRVVVPAVRAAVLGVVRALLLRRAALGVPPAHLDAVLLHMLAGRVVQMAVMQVVDVPLVPDRGVAAA